MSNYETIEVLIDIQEEDGWFIGTCPFLPGVVSQGKTQAELEKNMREALELWFETKNEIAYEKSRAAGHSTLKFAYQ